MALGKADVMLVVFEKGVHGYLQWGSDTLEHNPMNASCVYELPTASSADLSRSVGMAKSPPVCVGCISAHDGIPSSGDLRSIAADATGCGVDRRQHRRGLREAEQAGEGAFPQHSRRPS